MNNDIKPTKNDAPQEPEQKPMPPKNAFSGSAHNDEVGNAPKQEASPKALRNKKIYTNAVYVALGVLFLVAGLAIWYLIQLKPADKDGHDRRFIVETGQTMPQIAHNLDKEGLIRSSLAFQWYVRTKGVNNNLQAGAYALSSSQSVSEIVDYLVEGKVLPFRVTILPGRTLNELKADLVKEYGFSEAEVEQALRADYNHPLLRTKPANAGLEGYIFPETYDIQASSAPEELFKKSFDVFYERLRSTGVINRLQKRDVSIYDAINMASIIQREVSGVDDQKQVAQIIYKRLSIDMALGMDSTSVYAAKQRGIEATGEVIVGIDSPYNTRTNRGLPPTPIANFNFSAIEAVASPASGDYLYFVSGDGDYAGKTFFARTSDEHDQNVANYCQELCR